MDGLAEDSRCRARCWLRKLRQGLCPILTLAITCGRFRDELSDRPELFQSADAADSPYHCGWWYRKEFTASRVFAHGRTHSGCTLAASTIAAKSGSTATRSQIPQRWPAPIAPTTSMSPIFKPGKENVLAVETLRRLRKTWASTGSTGILARRIKTWDCGAPSTWSHPARSRCARRWR